MMRLAICCGMMLALTSSANAGRHLPEAPAYVRSYLQNVDTAKRFGLYCDYVNFNRPAAERALERLLLRLERDGYVGGTLEDRVEMPTQRERVSAVEQALAPVHARGNPEVEFCKAARRAEAIGDEIGQYLWADKW